MLQNRFNVFNQVHKGLRALLYDTALKIQQTDFTDMLQGSLTIKAVEDVVFLFEDHAHNEDSFILPAVGKFDSNIITVFENEHAEDERLSKILLAASAAWQASDEDGRYDIGQIIFYQFNAFVAFNLYHMNKEETVLNEALWKYYSDLEIIQIMNELLASLPPNVMNAEAPWMVRGMNDPEIITWLQEVKQHAAAPIFGMLSGLAQSELPVARWENIKVVLDEALILI